MTVEAPFRFGTKEVHSDSSDFLETALRTLPEEIHPIYFSVGFSVLDPREFEFPTTFSKSRVIPRTVMHLEWEYVNPDTGRYVPRAKFLEFTGTVDGLPGGIDLFKEIVLAGGKPQEVVYKGGYHARQAYESLLASKIEQMKKAGYHIHEGDLAIVGNGDGYEPRTSIVLEHNNQDSSVTVKDRGTHLAGEKLNLLNQWLGELVKIQ